MKFSPLPSPTYIYPFRPLHLCFRVHKHRICRADRAKSAGPRSDAFCRAPPVQAHIMDTTDAHRLPHDDDAHLYSCEEYSRALASDLSLENARNLLKRQAGLRSNRRASPEARRSCRDSSSDAVARKDSVSPASHVVNWLVDRANRLATFRSAQTPLHAKSPPHTMYSARSD